MGVFDGSIGPFVVGIFIALFLNGITVSQTFKYFQTFKSDRTVYKVLVGGLAAFDLFHTAISCYTVYLWCVTHYMDVAFLAKSPWSFAIEPAMTGIVSAIVQFFYAYRVYVIGHRSIWLPTLICFVSLLQLGFACGATGMIFYLQFFEKFQTWTYGVLIWLFSAAACDFIITSTLVYHLRNSKAEWQRTNSTVDHIIKMTVETNGLTLIVASIDAILFASSSLSWHVIPQLSLIKLYFLSLLVSLNSRASVAARLAASTAAYPSTRVAEIEPKSFGSAFSRPRKNPGVKVTVEESIITDKLEDRFTASADKDEQSLEGAKVTIKENEVLQLRREKNSNPDLNRPSSARNTNENGW